MTKEVVVQCVSSVIDERSGLPFRWRVRFDTRAEADAFADDVNAGRIRTSFDIPWPKACATILEDPPNSKLQTPNSKLQR